jgi:hypothetical protein
VTEASGEASLTVKITYDRDSAVPVGGAVLPGAAVTSLPGQP